LDQHNVKQELLSSNEGRRCEDKNAGLLATVVPSLVVWEFSTTFRFSSYSCRLDGWAAASILGKKALQRFFVSFWALFPSEK
jgi:uncharacterized protein Veg